MSFVYRRRVEFADTDTAQLIHFTSLLRYMEEAEHALYRSLGHAGYEWREDGVSGIPRISVHCDYLGPLRYGEEVDVRLSVAEVRSKAIRYEADFTVDRADGRALVAKGTMVVVHAARPHGTLDWAGEKLPASLRSALEAAAAQTGDGADRDGPDERDAD
ncbi:MAG: acyl-CoA thioesterase [Gemmatimonadetes bacterium]|nr:acyl-CoA thioesterase [Gemmatimonadota bacterium]